MHEELMDIFIGLAQATRCCRQEAAFCQGVTFHQFIILDAAAKSKELHISDLHKILSIEKSTTTRLINPLIRKGLLKRDQTRHDFRAAVLILTDEGKAVHKEVWLCLRDFLGKVISSIPIGKRKVSLESVRVFIRAIQNSTNNHTC